MAKPKKHTKKKATRRVQNAFEIASAEVNAANDDYSDDSDNGTIINSRKFTRKGGDDEDEDDDEEFEDEEIDSDEAMGSDDEYDVLNSKFSQTIRDKAQKKKKAEKEGLTLDEESDEEDYNSVDENEFVSLTEAWDLDDQAQANKDLVLDDDLESESESEDSSDEEESDHESEEEFPDEVEESDEDSEVELTSLKQSLKKLDPTKTKKHYQTSTVAENELALPGGGAEITLSDMLSVIDPSASKEAVLIHRDLETPGAEDSNKALAVPLPKRIQQRKERNAAYQITKDEISKWDETVKKIRNTEILQFPLPQQEESETDSEEEENPTINKNQKKESSTYDEITKPMNDLESKINSILTESKLVDDSIEQKFEEIQTAKLNKEDLRKRQGELRKMRELMFRQEREARRIKKIKSKSYHRIKKKELLKTQQLVDEANGESEEDDEDHDMKRAQERMSLKYKNTSKWAQRMIKSGMSKDSEARREMEEMLVRGERLKSKILGREDGDYDEFNDENDLDIDREMNEESDSEIREKTGKTGVMNMAFMKNAEAKERSANEEYKARLRQLNHDEDIESFENDINEDSKDLGVNIQLNSGRRIYAPEAQESRNEIQKLSKEVLEEDEIDNSKSLKNKISNKFNISKKPLQSTNIEKEQEEEEADESNPWLMEGDEDKSVLRSKKLRIIDESSSKIDKSALKINKKRKLINESKSKKSNNEEEFIDMHETLNIIDPHADNNDSENEDTGIHMFKQKDLIKQAFAGDDVISEFNEEKRQVIIDEGDQIEDLSMPGWGGDWAGGNPNKKKRKYQNLKVTKGIDSEKRRDKDLNNVIINEKSIKRNFKYESSAVPFPYESKEQYERSLRMPIGQEWTSRDAHQRLTMPKVIAKRGVVINPLKKQSK